ncbi:MAG TPA: sigma-70 family RNA polymerase sigma factor [candidate division Zixibacteria bacterium]|nr:sigma-70 family RNA polymerase sigma factor [candidate division Zixibacteria bacterium]
MGDGKRASVEELVGACREGAEWAWRELLGRVSPLVLALCRDSRLSAEESLDIFGQVCYLLVRNIDRIRNPRRTYAFVATITRRQIYNRFHEDRGLEFVDTDRLGETVEDPAGGPDRKFEETEQRLLLTEAIAMLPPRDYELLTALFFDEDKPSYEEIGARLGMPVPSIGPTRARALQRLERLLVRMGYKFDVF